MDDYDTNVVTAARGEYTARLVNILTPLMIQGIKSIYNDAIKICIENDEEEKYLMTFQNYLSRVPKWNSTIIQEETNRIIDESKCSYLAELISSVHTAQLKILTSIRVSQQQKKIDIDIPNLNDYIHKCYIEFARKIYKNVYLFEKDILPLDYQKNMRECEILCNESILNTIRNNMPIETILKAYMDEAVEEEIIEELVIKDLEQKTDDDDDKSNEVESNDVESNDVESNDVKSNDVESNDLESNDVKSNDVESNVEKINVEKSNENNLIKKDNNNKLINDDNLLEDIVANKLNNNEIKHNNLEMDLPKTMLNNNDNEQTIKFNNNDRVLDMGSNKEEIVNAPKDVDTLEKISDIRHEQRKLEEEEYDDDDDDDYENETLKISDTPLNLGILDIHDINKDVKIEPTPLITDIEIL